MPASLAAYRKDLEKSPDFLRLLNCSGNKTLAFPSPALVAASSMSERTCVLVLPSPKKLRKHGRGAWSGGEATESKRRCFPPPKPFLSSSCLQGLRRCLKGTAS